MNTEERKNFLPLLTDIVKSLVEHPEEVNVTPSESYHHVIYAVKTARSDVGKIIGKQGRTAEALKLLMSNIGARHNRKVMVDFYTWDDQPAVEQRRAA